MKRLYLLRHAEARSSQGGTDKERTLSDQGIEDAKALGKAMRTRGYIPDLIYCSDARRTAQTFDNVALGAELKSPAEMLSRLYDASRGKLLTEIQNAPDRAQALMLIGHNPAIYELSAMLASEGDERALSLLAQGYSPATLSVIDVPAESWDDIDPDRCVLKDLLVTLDYNAPERPTRWM